MGAAQNTSTDPAAGAHAFRPSTSASTDPLVVPLPALHFQLPPTTGVREAAARVVENARPRARQVLLTNMCVLVCE